MVLGFAKSVSDARREVSPARLKEIVDEMFTAFLKGNDFAGTQTGVSSGDLGGDQPYQTPSAEPGTPESAALVTLLIGMLVSMGFSADDARRVAYEMLGGSVPMDPGSPGEAHPPTPSNGGQGVGGSQPPGVVGQQASTNLAHQKAAERYW
jgi:hypothetical protein